MRALIIGGTGFIGEHVVRQLAAAGHEVAIFHRGKKTIVLPKTVREILDSESATPIVKFPSAAFDFEPEVVIHTMAMGSADAKAVVDAFVGVAKRLVVLSSGDVYQAYGRLLGIEPGPAEDGLLSENSSLRTVLFPYRKDAPSHDALQYWYDKILVERTVLNSSVLPSVVLRLPKVYGPGGNADLATVYHYRHQPNWRWTHGYVENVAAAVVLAASAGITRSRIYNVGEEHTPTIAERLSWMPESKLEPDLKSPMNFAHNMAYDTSRIRKELGYRELIPEKEAMLQTLGRAP
ncbi:MAG TPA: NAD-dependent epimerase/dehydratase family protein [Candidatus Sulfotelmatobacter sp.]|nr:NAD-dependent epimerase/dehydratase family protein [Candidatus Sulfotelmatobacter sp.]